MTTRALANVIPLESLAASARPLGELRVDVGPAVVRTAAYDLGDRVAVPLSVTLEGGGFLRGMIEVDPDTFNRAVAFARDHGLDHVRLADLCERFTGVRPWISIAARPVLPR